uniref:hypothetical protein n=1 Tax=uncultured Duncaniella sp. TaxID=2768039 RepID=UPI002711E930
LLKINDLTKFLVLNFHAKHQIFNGLNTWLLGAVNKFSKNNRSIEKRGCAYFDTASFNILIVRRHKATIT